MHDIPMFREYLLKYYLFFPFLSSRPAYGLLFRRSVLRCVEASEREVARQERVAPLGSAPILRKTDIAYF